MEKTTEMMNDIDRSRSWSSAAVSSENCPGSSATSETRATEARSVEGPAEGRPCSEDRPARVNSSTDGLALMDQGPPIAGNRAEFRE